MTSNEQKAAVYLVGFSVLGFLAYQAYQKIKSGKNPAMTWAGALNSAVSDAIQSAQDSVNGALMLAGNNRLYTNSGDKPYHLKTNEYSPSVLAYIRDWNRMHARKDADFSGFQIYSDGTNITPDGVYTQFNNSSIAMDSIDGYAVTDIWKPGNYTEGNITPMTAENLAQADKIMAADYSTKNGTSSGSLNLSSDASVKNSFNYFAVGSTPFYKPDIANGLGPGIMYDINGLALNPDGNPLFN